MFRRVFYYCRPPFTHCQSLQRLTAHFEHSHPSTTSTPHNFAFSTFTTCFYVFLITVDCWRVLLHTRTLLRPPPAISATRHSFPRLYFQLWPLTPISSPFPVFSTNTTCFYAFTTSVDPLRVPERIPRLTHAFLWPTALFHLHFRTFLPFWLILTSLIHFQLLYLKLRTTFKSYYVPTSTCSRLRNQPPIFKAYRSLFPYSRSFSPIFIPFFILFISFQQFTILLQLTEPFSTTYTPLRPFSSEILAVSGCFRPF